ncbi:MAG: HAD hydrolase-like protein [Candidatus Binatia bacterium]
MATATFLVRTMSDTVETDIQRVLTITTEILPRYGMHPLPFERLRKIADGPFDLFLIPLVYADEYKTNPNVVFDEKKRLAIRTQALEIARKHGFDTKSPNFVPGIEESLKKTQAAGLRNVLLTTGGRRYQHNAMEAFGIGKYFAEIVDRDETYYAKEQGLYYLFRQHKLPSLRILLLTGTASYIRAGNNVDGCKVAGTQLEVITIALSNGYSYNDEDTLTAAKPNLLIHGDDELLPNLQQNGLLPEA